MKDYIEMFLGTSGNGNAIYSSVKRVMTKFGPMYQGTPKGTKIGLPWFISITVVDDEECEPVIWVNKTNGSHLTPKEYKAKFLSSTAPDDDRASESATTNQ